MSINPLGGLTLQQAVGQGNGQGQRDHVANDPGATGETGGSGETGGTGQTKTDNDNSGSSNNPNSGNGGGSGAATQPSPAALIPALPEPARPEAPTDKSTSGLPAQNLAVEEAHGPAKAVQEELRRTHLIEQMTRASQAAETAATQDRRFAESAEIVRDLESQRSETSVDSLT